LQAACFSAGGLKLWFTSCTGARVKPISRVANALFIKDRDYLPLTAGQLLPYLLFNTFGVRIDLMKKQDAPPKRRSILQERIEYQK
jgi:hypothetical protein